MLPATAVGMYGIINQYGLKMVGGPIGGFMSDKVHNLPQNTSASVFLYVLSQWQRS